MLILGIETSCDDTSICLLNYHEEGSQVKFLESFSSEKILARWGGVVPEIAARNHLEKVFPLLQTGFEETGHGLSDIDLIGVTTHPGLLGPLLTGLSTAKSISMLERIPIFPVNHLFAHLEVIHLTESVSYPYLGLLVSGGHSVFFLVRSPQDFEVVGTTIDDAAGEAFDKGGKLLQLPYPAGRIIDDKAKQGHADKYEFPIGLRHEPNANLSYSGLKTSLRNFVEENPQILKDQNSQDFFDVCASYQHSIVEALVIKTKQAQKKVGANLPIVVGGGVACNSYLRSQMTSHYGNVFFVPPKYCTDNAGMIAFYAALNADKAVAFPTCLELDAQSKFIDKKSATAP